MAGESYFDQVLDEVLPDDFDWRGLVVDYPLAAVTLSLAGGVWLGRAHGSELLSGLTDFAFREVSRNVQSFVGDLAGQVRYRAGQATDADGYDDFSDDLDGEDGSY